MASKPLHTNIYSNGIHYLNLMFDIGDITEEELPHLGMLKAVLGYMDTEHYNYADLANEIDLKTGGISSQINIYADTKKKDSFHAKIRSTFQDSLSEFRRGA